MIKGSDDTRYAYVNGVVRAREARLLNKGYFDRLIASDFLSFNALISDTPYVTHGDVIAGFEIEEMETRKFFNQYCLTLEVNKFLDWPEQIHNLKVKLKNGSKDIMYTHETTEVETWPEVIEEAARFTVDKDPFILSTNLDKILCQYLYRNAEPMQFFAEYYKRYFDLENIRSFFRARQFEKTQEIFDQVFIPWGNIKKKIFLENLNVHHDLLGKNFGNTPYAMIMDRGSAYLEEQHSFLRLERFCEEMRLGFLLQARMMTFGIEPLFAYYHFKINEIKKLRQVHSGKLNELPAEDLKESIPDVW